MELDIGSMFITLFHAEPVVYGIVIILGIATIIWKLARGRVFAAALEISIFWLVFSLHGGTMTGGMSAAVAALLGGFIIPATIRLARW